MSDIVYKIQQEIIKRSNDFEKQTKGTKDEYNHYNGHIKYVYKYVCILSKNKNVDREVLELSALLHDISLIDINRDRDKHHIHSSLIAEKLLRDNNGILKINFENKLTKDYNEMSNNIKYLIQDKYNKVVNAKSIKDILDIK